MAKQSEAQQQWMRSIPFVFSGIAKTERRKTCGTIRAPVFAFAQRAVLEKFALIIRAKIIAERCILFSLSCMECSGSKNNGENEDKDAGEKRKNR